MDLLQTDDDLNAFTGINRLSDLNKIASMADNIMLKLHYDIKFLLNTTERIFLTLAKLKLNISYKCLAVFFNISDTTCKNYFLETIDILYLVLKTVIVWSSKDIVRRNMPKCFKNYIDTRVILNCIETSVERPKCLTCRIRTYSHYKGNHTIKSMIGISPDGLICFLSNVYGGRASDKIIFNESDILNKCIEGDAIMVDKGFLIDAECAEKGIKLHRHPFLGKQKQLSVEDGFQNSEIARARVHVERAIQRIKIFKIFPTKVPWIYLQKIDNIMTIICGIVNITKPIISDKKDLT